MEAVVPIVLVLVLGIVVLFLGTRRFSATERSLLGLSFLGHALAAFLNIWLIEQVYGIGDLMWYVQVGNEYAARLRGDFAATAPEVLGLLFHVSSWTFPLTGPLDNAPTGDSTSSMAALAGVLLFLLNGSRHAMCVATALFSCFSKFQLYAVFRTSFPPALRLRLLIATTLMPSVVIWCGGFIKEALAVGFLSWMVFGLQRALEGRFVVGIAALLPSAVGLALFKPYILITVVLAAGVWLYWQRALRLGGGRVRGIRPLYLLLGAALSIGGVWALGKLFPQFALDRLAETTASMQTYGAEVSADSGSYYSLNTSGDRSLAGQLAYAPLALVASLFRPSLLDVRSALMFVNALETTALTALFVSVVVRTRWRQLRSVLAGSGLLMFCLTFTLVFGVAVGLATTNFGTLSRYRMPLVPFFAAILLVWSAPALHARTPPVYVRAAAGPSGA